MERRGIELGPAEIDRLRTAMDTLERKGSRNSLVMLEDLAFVVHVPTHTVVTAIAPDQSKESVFTQIDSVAFA
jgi:flagellar operon protein